jgi:hypothetical protein
MSTSIPTFPIGKGEIKKKAVKRDENTEQNKPNNLFFLFTNVAM